MSFPSLATPGQLRIRLLWDGQAQGQAMITYKNIKLDHVFCGTVPRASNLPSLSIPLRFLW